ncbi:hypothetical protein GTY62_15295 [Streptomyces sp. SID724]|uniref:hypothetical protein n=1 Tax=Streptomyces sp. SID724 TaxID=2690324 RepID=UPI001360D8BC|nr:hypothetical protein [Streptomyces sp. SID724]
MADEVDIKAPHGRDEQGVPLAPYGYKTNGDPKLSNRGRAPAPGKKPTPNVKSGARPKSRTQGETRHQLVELGRMFTSPLVPLSKNAMVRKKIGDRQAMALAGDAVILDMHVEPAVDALMTAAQTRPGLLAWMDKAEDLGPAVMGLRVVASLTKALAENHMNPDERLARAGESMLKIRAAKYAAAIEAEAAALGLVDDEPAIPEQRVA